MYSSNKNKWVRSFPDPLASDEEKNKKDYGFSFGKAIEYEWWFRPNDGSSQFYDKRDRYHQLRIYARGEQPTKLYKDILLGGDDETYTNLDWTPIQIAPKFVNLIVNQMTERLFKVRAESTDKFSTDLKDKKRKSLQHLIYQKPLAQKAQEVLGVNILPEDIDSFPSTLEEVDLYMKIKYKLGIEIATEEALNYTLSLNDYEDIQQRIIQDLAVIGIGAISHRTDPVKGLEITYEDPADMVFSYPNESNFKNVNYYGRVRRISVNELKRICNEELSDEQIREIGKSTNSWNTYHGNSNLDNNYREDDLSGFMCDVLDFTFKSTNTLTYKKKYNSNGGFKLIPKESTFTKEDPTYKGFDVIKKVVDVWYEGSLVLGTEYMFNYRKCEDMIRPSGSLNITQPNFIVHVPELYQNRYKSLFERVIPYIDQMQQIHMKIQQFIAKARPNGVFIDVDGINEIDLGDGNFLSPLEAMKIYDETGNVLGTSKNADGSYNQGKVPIVELRNGVLDGVERLIGSYNHYLNLLRDAIGIPQGSDASMPHPDTLVGVQQQVAQSSNVATRHILNAALMMTERMCEGLVLSFASIFKNDNIRQAYMKAIGKSNTDVLKDMNEFSLHDVGIMIELKPDQQEKNFLEANIQAALSRDTITLADANDIRTINNIKLANEVLKANIERRAKEKREFEKQMEQLRAQGNQQSAMVASQAKLQEIQAKAQADAMVEAAKQKAKLETIEAEKKAKAELMMLEYQLATGRKQFEDQQKLQDADRKEKHDEEMRKMDASQQSQLIDQRNKKGAPIDFQSSNVLGGVDFDEVNPS